MFSLTPEQEDTLYTAEKPFLRPHRVRNCRLPFRIVLNLSLFFCWSTLACKTGDPLQASAKGGGRFVCACVSYWRNPRKDIALGLKGTRNPPGITDVSLNLWDHTAPPTSSFLTASPLATIFLPGCHGPHAHQALSPFWKDLPRPSHLTISVSPRYTLSDNPVYPSCLYCCNAPNICVPPHTQIHMLKPNPHCDVIRRWGF